jgi:hypothetical protein
VSWVWPDLEAVEAVLSVSLWWSSFKHASAASISFTTASSANDSSRINSSLNKSGSILFFEALPKACVPRTTLLQAWRNLSEWLSSSPPSSRNCSTRWCASSGKATKDSLMIPFKIESRASIAQKWQELL